MTILGRDDDGRETKLNDKKRSRAFIASEPREGATKLEPLVAAILTKWDRTNFDEKLLNIHQQPLCQTRPYVY